MKKIGLVGIMLFFAAIGVLASTQNLKSNINSVTVYPVGAMIERSASFTFKANQEIIQLHGLTYAIDPNTVQVAGMGDFEIVSVKFENQYPKLNQPNKRIKVLTDSIAYVNDLIFLLDAKEKAILTELDLIKENKNHATKAMNIQELSEMSKFYQTQFADISQRQLKVQKDMEDAHAEKSRLHAEKNRMNQLQYAQEGVILIEVNGQPGKKGKLNFSYFTHLASWFPNYKVEANEKATSINFDLSAFVSQSTGVNWDNVDLKLSTSRPTFNNQKPELHPWFLDFVNPSLQVRASGSYGDFFSEELATEQDVEMEDEMAANVVFEKGEFKKQKVSKSAGFVKGQEIMNGLNVAYQIEKPYSIPSNKNRKSVFIKTISVPAMFSYYTAPRKETNAYLTAHMADFSKYDLIPGAATLFYNNTYVGKTFVNALVTDDSLSLSFGVNQNIIVTYDKVQDLCAHKKIGANIKRNYVYDISVKNANNTEVEIDIFELIPVSKRSDIEVTINGVEGGSIDKETGIVKWQKKIGANENVTIRVSYEVKYPKGKYLNI